ncbi:MAG: DUF2254 domain-containing protein, partial [Humibacillus sp.]|nr:DUF2254 domain-containing protein [Humibacillus sp.]
MSWAGFFEFRQHLRQSLWVVPLLGATAGVFLSQTVPGLEQRLDLTADWSYSAATASSVLAAIAGAMVGLIGLVVTIGVLVVQMATGTLSARFMRLWYRDRVQKLVLAAFTATFTFSYALLRRVEPDSVPNVGVTAAGVAVTIDLILLLVYVNRFVHMLRPVAVGAVMAKAGLDIVHKLGAQAPPASDGPDQGRANRAGADAPNAEPDLRVRTNRSGAIQAVNTDGIVKHAVSRGLVCVIPNAMGDFVTVGDVLFDVYGPATERDSRRLRGMIALGNERTIDQDPAFALRILVDIAIRALSPAVNDPTTATQMINHIGALLNGLGSSVPAGHGVWRGPDGRVRLAVPTRSWEEYLQLGVCEVRQYGITSAQTSRRLRAMLVDLQDRIPRPPPPPGAPHQRQQGTPGPAGRPAPPPPPQAPGP